MNLISCYDPRDPEQVEDKPETWKPTKNPALVLAHFTVDMIKNLDVKLVDEWKKKVIEQANYADDRPFIVKLDYVPAEPIMTDEKFCDCY